MHELFLSSIRCDCVCLRSCLRFGIGGFSLLKKALVGRRQFIYVCGVAGVFNYFLEYRSTKVEK